MQWQWREVSGADILSGYPIGFCFLSFLGCPGELSWFFYESCCALISQCSGQLHSSAGIFFSPDPGLGIFCGPWRLV